MTCLSYAIVLHQVQVVEKEINFKTASRQAWINSKTWINLRVYLGYNLNIVSHTGSLLFEYFNETYILGLFQGVDFGVLNYLWIRLTEATQWLIFVLYPKDSYVTTSKCILCSSHTDTR